MYNSSTSENACTLPKKTPWHTFINPTDSFGSYSLGEYKIENLLIEDFVTYHQTLSSSTVLSFVFVFISCHWETICSFGLWHWYDELQWVYLTNPTMHHTDVSQFTILHPKYACVNIPQCIICAHVQILVNKCCIVRYGTGALWDWWGWFNRFTWYCKLDNAVVLGWLPGPLNCGFDEIIIQIWKIKRNSVFDIISISSNLCHSNQNFPSANVYQVVQTYINMGLYSNMTTIKTACIQ